MRAEREGHPSPHAVQTEGSPGASGKHGAPEAAGESGEDRPAYRIHPGAPSGDVELGVRAPRGTPRGPGGDCIREAEAGRETAPGGPFGGGERTTAPLWEYDLLGTAARALRSAELHAIDFEPAMSRATEGDFIYCDPT